MNYNEIPDSTCAWRSNRTNQWNGFIYHPQIDHFDSDCFTAQDNHFDNTQDEGQTQCDDVYNSGDESYNELDSSQQLDGMESNKIVHQEN